MNRVKEYRQTVGFSQAKLAEQVGVARQTINLIENDKYNPSLDLCIRLAKSITDGLKCIVLESEVDEEVE